MRVLEAGTGRSNLGVGSGFDSKREQGVYAFLLKYRATFIPGISFF